MYLQSNTSTPFYCPPPIALLLPNQIGLSIFKIVERRVLQVTILIMCIYTNFDLFNGGFSGFPNLKWIISMCLFNEISFISF